jgi:hypothetical protein
LRKPTRRRTYIILYNIVTAANLPLLSSPYPPPRRQNLPSKTRARSGGRAEITPRLPPRPSSPATRARARARHISLYGSRRARPLVASPCTGTRGPPPRRGDTPPRQHGAPNPTVLPPAAPAPAPAPAPAAPGVPSPSSAGADRPPAPLPPPQLRRRGGSPPQLLPPAGQPAIQPPRRGSITSCSHSPATFFRVHDSSPCLFFFFCPLHHA